MEKKETRKLVIKQDSDPQSPREWDNLGTIAYKHNRYVLGEETISDPVDWLEEKLGLQLSRVHTNERLEELKERFFNEYIAYPLYLYDHSGITISTEPFHCPWDSGMVGFIYVSKKDARENYGVKKITPKIREKVLSILNAEIEIFDNFLRGEVYGFEILNEDDEVIDSCWGFFGDDWDVNGIKDYIPEELHSQLDDVNIIYD